MGALELKRTDEGQISPLQDIEEARRTVQSELQGDLVNTPFLKLHLNEFECCLAPVKPVKRNAIKVTRAGNAGLRVIRDSMLIPSNVLEGGCGDFLHTPLRFFPSLEVVADDGKRMIEGAAKKGCREDDEDQSLVRPLRFCTDFGSDLNDECTFSCKRIMDTSPLQSFLMPPLVGR